MNFKIHQGFLKNRSRYEVGNNTHFHCFRVINNGAGVKTLGGVLHLQRWRIKCCALSRTAGADVLIMKHGHALLIC